MGKELVTKFNFSLEVVETKALVDEWKGVALTWWSVDGKLCSKLWKAHQTLIDSKVGHKDSKVGVPTVKDFYEAIGMKRSTFYNFINRTKELVEAGADIENMSGNMKAIADMTGKTELEIELEDKVANQEKELASREKAADEYKEGVKAEHKKVLDANKTIRELKKEAKEQAEPDPELMKKIEELGERQEKLEKSTDWYTTASSFKAEMTVLLDSMTKVEMLGKKILSSKKPK